VRIYRPKIFRFALASLRDRDAAETIAQDCLMRAHKNHARFRGDCSVQTWLMQIAVNLVRDHLRNRRLRFWKRTMESNAPDSLATYLNREHSAEMTLLMKERVAAVWAAAEKLPERQKTVFLLRFVEDMDILEIAAAAGMKEGTVKANLFRALAAVRDKLTR
jgi:RNA polymerase sigma-70 factor, ECF subfamily